MKLLNTQSHRFCQFTSDDVPPFAVFSTYLAKPGDDVSVDATCKSQIEQPIPNDVIRACSESNNRGISYLWSYSTCVDKSSSADIDEAINASFRWLGKATICLAYLADLESDESSLNEDAWKESAYWKNPWTLQELIAPKSVEFFDANWKHLGSKSSPELTPLISNISGIPKNILLDGQQLWESAVAMRIAWAADRQSDREEDVAYSLVGLTGVNMSSRYGEGAERAFSRLQKKILKETTDGSIFAWRSKDETEIRGVLANSPSEFRQFVIANGRGRQIPWIFDGLIRQNNRGIEVRSRISRLGPCILMEIGRRGESMTQCERIGIWLREWNGAYVRVNPTSIVKIPEPGAPFTINLSRHMDSKLSNLIKLQFDKEKDKSSQLTSKAHNSRSPSPQSGLEGLHTSKLPAPVTSGVKRERSGKPKLHLDDSQKTANKYISPLTTPSVYSPDSRQNRGQCEPLEFCNSPTPKAEEDDPIFKNGDIKDKIMDAKQAFQSLKAAMTQFCYSRMQEWMHLNPSDVHLEDAPTPRKRARTDDENDGNEHIKIEDNNNDVVTQGAENLSSNCSAEPTVELVNKFWDKCGRDCVDEHLQKLGLGINAFEDHDSLVQFSLLALESLREMAIPDDEAEKQQDQR